MIESLSLTGTLVRTLPMTITLFTKKDIQSNYTAEVMWQGLMSNNKRRSNPNFTAIFWRGEEQRMKKNRKSRFHFICRLSGKADQIGSDLNDQKHFIGQKHECQICFIVESCLLLIYVHTGNLTHA